jgi:hypothetical protein
MKRPGASAFQHDEHVQCIPGLRCLSDYVCGLNELVPHRGTEGLAFKFTECWNLVVASDASPRGAAIFSSDSVIVLNQCRTSSQGQFPLRAKVLIP